MPDFSVDDLDIDPDEYLDACSTREIKEVIEWLVTNDHISKSSIGGDGNDNLNVNEEIFQESVIAISKSRLSLSIEEEEYIVKLGEKFKHLY